jgi:nucleoid DNA-binding protein
MTLTKRDLVNQITDELNREQEKVEREQSGQQKSPSAVPGRKKQEPRLLEQRQVFDVVQKALDTITRALANGQKVELRNFGIFEVTVRKARIGRNPHAPDTDVLIPARSVVKFKAGKEMRAEVMKLPVKPAPRAAKPPGQK